MNGVKGRDLVREFIEVDLIRGAVFEADESGAWVLSEEGSKLLKGIVLGANGFRERTLPELGVFGLRPSGVFPLYSAWELVNRGYRIGEKVVIYGFNHYSLSLASKLKAEVTFIAGSGSIVHDEVEALDKGFGVLKARLKRVEGRGRLECLKTDRGDLKADTLVLAELSPWNPLGLSYTVGNAAMVTEDPSKIVEGARLLASSILSGGRRIEVISETPCFPQEVAEEVGRVIVSVRRGTKLWVGSVEMVVGEPYPIIEVPKGDRVRIEVLGCTE
ncbi:MAG: hypothetical protein NZ992_02190 [Candidatus Korarchaeum sp.]|nr:hypothetical protein [Candidatus Korarchaeum sp.]MDW8035147.1 hypothetical protein [Candidatus Korarchaeum sp.]